MKTKIILATIFYWIFVFNLNAQIHKDLWGMTSGGGENSMGCIFKVDENGENAQVIYSFGDNFMRLPKYSFFCEATNGKLYGMTKMGGNQNFGVLFEFDPFTSTFQKIIDFNGVANGSNPEGSLVQGSNGNLYGMTSQGGIYSKGVLFEYNLSTSTYSKKIDFDESFSGSNPSGTLIQASNGKLYGMTAQGGNNAMGVLFEFDPVTSSYVKKIDFDGITYGANPHGSLIQASNGKLYGMTSNGGDYNKGVMFEFDPSTSNFIKKIDFNGTSIGQNPHGSLVEVSNGNLYGMTFRGGNNDEGVIFEYNLSTSSYIKKLDFDNNSNGSNPESTLIQASNGKLYGMTGLGGNNSKGVLFEYDPSTSICTKKFDFDGVTNGQFPSGSLMQASNGKLYGMVSEGGCNGVGIMFEFDPITSIFTKKIDFSSYSNGRDPRGSLLHSTNDKLYGLCSKGGGYDFGVLFEYDPINYTYTAKFNFEGTNGKVPYGSLCQASNGKLYGMTNLGGINNMGVLFEYDISTSTFTKKIDFMGVTNGSNPFGSLFEASNGKLYGMTFSGGSNNMGILFEYDPNTSVFTKKIDFNSTNGRNPEGSLIEANNGKLYGLTYWGGNYGLGVLFEYDPNTSTYVKKHNFAGPSNGSYPLGSLIQATNGKLYGMTYWGGNYSLGVLFEYELSTSTCSKKIDFNGTSNGGESLGSLLQASNGKLYGMTSTGGIDSTGVLFEYNPFDSTFVKKNDFVGSNGRTPFYTQLIEICVFPRLTEQPHNICNGNTSMFSIKAVGNNLTYQWQVNDGNGFTNISDNNTFSGAQNDTLLLSGALSILNGYSFHCKVSSDCPALSFFSNTVYLSNNPIYFLAENQSICEGENYIWQNSSYTEPGNYYKYYTTEYGCDSTYMLNLSVNPQYEFIENQSICVGDNYTWQDSSYSTTGNYHKNYTTKNGCDSTYLLNLTVNPEFEFIENLIICEGESYIWQDSTYTTTGIYYKNYNSIKGCDSTYILNLIVNSCNGLDQKNISDFEIFPNPTSAILTIHLPIIEDINLTLNNSLGKTILNEKFSQQKCIQIDISAFPTALYLLRITNDKGLIFEKKIILEK